MNPTPEQLKELVQKVDPTALLTWIAYMRMAWCNPSDRDVVMSSHRYENRHLNELREIISSLHGLLPEYRPFWPPVEDGLHKVVMRDLTVRAGTKYCTEMAGGVLSEKQTLKVDTQADLLASVSQWRIFRLPDGQKIYVQPNDDAPVPASEQ